MPLGQQQLAMRPEAQHGCQVPAHAASVAETGDSASAKTPGSAVAPSPQPATMKQANAALSANKRAAMVALGSSPILHLVLGVGARAPPLADPDVQELHAERKDHREVDVALVDVTAHALDYEEDPDEKQERKREDLDARVAID